MRDICLDPISHDIVISGGDLSVAEAVPQHIKQRLLTILGEWFLDLSIGLPWFSQILGKHRDLTLVEALIKASISETPGVESLTTFSVAASETQERTAVVKFDVILTGGAPATISLEV